jgi:predicted permease
MEQIARDARHALRALAAMPLQALVIVLSLAVGIGANTTVFSFLQSRVLQPLPGVDRASGLQLLEPRAETGSYPGASWMEFRDLVERLTAFEDLVAFRMQAFAVGDPAQVERISGLLVSANYFSALGLRPAAGRFFGPEDTHEAGRPAAVVLSYSFWRDRYGAAPEAVGRTLRVNGQPLTIVGVAPAQFEGTVIGIAFDLWVSATMSPLLLNGSRELEDRRARGYQVAGRLRTGATRAQAQTELDTAMRDLGALYPQSNAGFRAEVLPLWQSPRGPQRMLARALAVLQGIMLVLLLAVCANTATLLLARGSARRMEVGVRMALGGSPRDIARLLLTETLLLALLAAGVGGLIALWTTNAISAIPLTTGFPVRTAGTVDALTWSFAAALAAVSAVLVALAPAMRLCRAEPLQAVHGRTSRGTAGRGRRLLVDFQVAVAAAVLVAGGYFARGLQQTRELDPGFAIDGVLLARYDLSGRSVSPQGAKEFAERLVERVRAIPGIDAAAIAQQVPLDIHGLPLIAFAVEGRARDGSPRDRALSNVVSPGYFGMMRIPIVSGSDFVPLNDFSAPRQVLVNRAFVVRYLPELHPLGRVLEVGGREYVISGVVADSVSDAFGEPPMPCIYFSYRDRPWPAGQLHIRAGSGDERQLARAVRAALAGLDASVPLYDVRTLAEHVDINLGLRKIPTRVFLVLGPFMTLLTALGLYGLVSYAVTQRRTEIGVRMALGATRARIVGGIVLGYAGVVALGLVAGTAAAYAASARTSGGPVEAAVLLQAALLLLLMCAAATIVPALRATRVDPALTLRGRDAVSAG